MAPEPAKQTRSTPTAPGTLAGQREAMEILGVPRSTIHRWLEREQMPQPVDVIAAGPVWKRSKLAEFAAKRTAEAEAKAATPA